MLKSPGDRLTLINARIDRKRVPLRTIHPFTVRRLLDSPWKIAEICGSYSEAALGLETDSLVSSLILSTGILGIGNRQSGRVS